MSGNQRSLITVTSIFVFLGVASAAYSVYLSPSLWYDTATIGINLINRSYIELLEPLDYRQAVPVLFLFAQKLFLSIFSYSDYGLILLPFIAFVASIPLLWKLAESLTGERKIACAAVSLFCMSPLVLHYASEAKQYITDIFVLLALLLAVIHYQHNLQKQLLVLIFGGIVAILASHASVLLLPTLGLYLLYMHKGNPKALLKITLSCVFLLSFFSVFLLLMLKTTLTDIHLQQYWQKSFLPITSLLSQPEELWYFSTYIAKTLANITFGVPLHHWGWKPFAVLYGAGVVLLLYQRRIDMLILVVTPLLTHLAVSAFHLYPVAPRLMLYQGPLCIIVISILAARLHDANPWFSRIPIILFLPAVFTILFNNPWSFPERNMGIKLALQHIDKEAKPNESVYIFHQAKVAAMYYKETHYPGTNRPFIYGSERLDHAGPIPETLADFSGQLWIIITELDWEVKDEAEQGTNLLNYLNASGKLLDYYERPSVRVYYYVL